MPKTSRLRKPGTKPERRNRKKLRPLSPFSDPRVPTGHSNLTAFLLSCDSSTSIPEAVREYQEEWCQHPRNERLLISTFQDSTNDREEYTLACMECGRHKVYKGRPPGELVKRVVWRR